MIIVSKSKSINNKNNGIYFNKQRRRRKKLLQTIKKVLKPTH